MQGASETVESAAADVPGLIEGLMPDLVNYGLKVVGVIVLFIVGRIVAAKIGKMVQKSLEKKDFDNTLSKFFAAMTRVLVLIVVVLACLSIFGIETTSVAAALGAAFFAVGLAFQGSLSNFAAGVMLIVFRPFDVGDVITAGGSTGKVDVLGLFTTTLDTPDNRRITVPNSAIFGGSIENLTHHELRRVDVPVGTDYSADLKTVRAILEQAITKVESRRTDVDHQVYVVDLGASSIDWEVRVWCNAADWFTVREQTIHATKEALDAANIGIPFPQLDVHLDGGLKSA